MINNILVPLDGSALAEAALPYAKAIAARTGASVMLVRAAQNKSPLGDVTYDQQHYTIEKAEDYLSLVAADLVAHGLEVRTGVPYSGSAAEWIVEESQIRQSDLIIIGTHDRVGPDRWLHGSVAEGVVNRATIPVMLVRAGGAEQLAQRFLAEQPVVIVPVDGSELSEAALPVARQVAQILGARVVLVGVVPNPGELLAGQAGAIVTYAESEQSELEAQVSGYLKASVERARGSDASVQTVLRRGDPSTEIAAVAEEYAAAAVVMATHGRTGLVRSIVGSVAGGVLHLSSTPVVLIRPAELRGAEEPLVNQAAASPA